MDTIEVQGEKTGKKLNPNKLWRRSAPLGKRIPFTEFIDKFNKEHGIVTNEKEGGFKNLVSTGKTLEDAGYSSIQKGETEFSDQVSITKQDDIFYSPASEQQGNIIRYSMTDKAMGDVDPEGAATAQAATQPKGNSSMVLVFVLGTVVGVAGVIIYNKYK